ncbi:MAG TPA: alpha/beta hydrolase [Candidatus Binataceae bacterium]|nr:alpha/beta hydrolase [Candidatus Binataceae bacterium]
MTSLSKGIEPATRAFLDSVNANQGPQIYEIPVEQGRKLFAQLQNLPVNKIPVEIEDRTIPAGPKGRQEVRILRPSGTRGTLPVLLYTHGAGWVFGDEDIYDRLVRDLVAGSGAAMVFVKFSRSPEARYPVAIEEVYATLKYVSENGPALNLDPTRLAVAGDSVGGNMTAALTMLAKQRGGPKIGQQVLFYPVTNAHFDTASYREFATGHFLTLEAMKWFWNQYLPDEAKRREPTASPLQATIEQLQGLPPALVINGEYDVLRDEDEAYAHKLIEAGVRVTAVRFHGTIHDFVMLNALAETPATRGAINLACDHLRRFFAQPAAPA